MKIRIDQKNENDRMELNGEELTSGEGGTIKIQGIELNWYIEYGSKGYYLIIED